MLDDASVIKQRDPEGALAVAGAEYSQAEFDAMVWNGDNDGREIKNIVVGGMGGSALAALLLKTWLKSDIKIPIEVLRSYDLPGYVDANTLFIASSYSGNTEETLSALEQAEVKGAQLGI
ncbi:SIS domain-containing protein, partial [Patescibacteria group bacterium]